MRREDKKRKVTPHFPEATASAVPPEMVDVSCDPGYIALPATQMGQASSSSGIFEEDRKRGFEQAREREAKSRKFREDESDDEEDDKTMVGEFEVNQELAECGCVDAFEDCQYDVFHERTGEKLDSWLTQVAEKGKFTTQWVRVSSRGRDLVPCGDSSGGCPV